MEPKTTETQMVKEPSAMLTLRAKLKASEPEVQRFVVALEKENLKIIKQVAKLQAENVTLSNKIKLLEEEAKVPHPSIQINV